LESGTTITKGLDDSVDLAQPELAKYIPQNFLEKICTQLGKIEESDFDQELKKVIFSHVDFFDRLNKGSLDELIAHRTTEATTRIQHLTVELHQINERIITLTEKCSDEHRLQLNNLLSQKQLELDAHERSKPTEIQKPDNDPVKQKEIAEVAEVIELEKKHLTEYENRTLQMNQEKSRLAVLISTTNKLLERLDNLDRQVQAFIDSSEDELKTIDVPQESILKYTIDKQPLRDKQNVFTDAKTKADRELDPQIEGSLAQRKKLTESKISKLRTKLDEPNKKYQTYTSALKVWEKKKSEIEGTEDTTGTHNFYKKQIEELRYAPDQRNEATEQRLTKAKEIHSIIRHLAATYRELYAPVQEFIEKRPLARDKFQLNF